MEFKDKLRKLRTDAGLSQEALADIIHISRSAIAKYENGNGNPSEDTLKALAFYFGVDVKELKSDEIIKVENRRKKIIKLSTIIGSLTLVVGVITASIIGALHLNSGEENKSPSINDGSSSLIGVSANVGLYRLNDSVQVVEDNNDVYYVTNTFLSFTIDINPIFSDGSTPVVFNGNIANFDDQTFASIHYDYSNKNKTSYVVDFKKEGDFELFYSISGFHKSIKFICDNNSRAWDKYKKDMSTFYPWAKNTTKEDITNLRYEYMNSSIGPSYFRNIYYSNSETDISDAFNFLSATLYFSNSDLMVTGAGSKTITYYLNNSFKQSISLTNNVISITSSNYIVSHSFSIPEDYNEYRYGFNIYGDNIMAINLEDNSEYRISYFYDIEFVGWPNEEIYDEVDPLYAISGYPVEDINIYSQNRFSYLGKMYKIVSEQNFNSLFN